MATISVDVDIYLDDFDDDELIEELEARDYNVSKEKQPNAEDIDKYEVEYLLDLVDKAEKRCYNYYTLREKLNHLRWG